ncbi:MAG: hypothetical protein J6386_14255 [Candidatus Synoicihabitans palmerolidicus]|nr:hypothetical protein [Candidatus Synoicihabitans palmerolidicus]
MRQLAARLPTYVTIKEVKKRWGHGQEDVYPVTQFEKLWGDMSRPRRHLQCLRRRPARPVVNSSRTKLNSTAGHATAAPTISHPCVSGE